MTSALGASDASEALYPVLAHSIAAGREPVETAGFNHPSNTDLDSVTTITTTTTTPPSSDLPTISPLPLAPTLTEHIRTRLVSHFVHTLSQNTSPRSISSFNNTPTSLAGWNPRIEVAYGTPSLLQYTRGGKPDLTGAGYRMHDRVVRRTITVPVQLSVDESDCVRSFWSSRQVPSGEGIDQGLHQGEGTDRHRDVGRQSIGVDTSHGCLSCLPLPLSAPRFTRDPIEKRFQWPHHPDPPNQRLLGTLTSGADIEKRVQRDFGMSMDLFLERSDL